MECKEVVSKLQKCLTSEWQYAMLKVEDLISMRMRGKIVMKRIGVLGLLLAILFQLCSCNGNNGGKQENETDAAIETDGISEADKEVTSGIPVIDTVLRAYFRLTDDEPLTQEMFDDVYMLRIARTNYTVKQEGRTLISVTVNGDERMGGVVEKCIDVDRFDALFGDILRMSPEEAEDPKRLERDQNYITSYYKKYDINDPELTERRIHELITAYPQLMKGPLHVFKAQEESVDSYNDIACLMERYGLLENKFMDSLVLRKEDLACFPNLSVLFLDNEITLEGDFRDQIVHIFWQTLIDHDITDGCEECWKGNIRAE
jgi:hypothetical protein